MSCTIAIIGFPGQTDLGCKNWDMCLGSSRSTVARSQDPGGKAAIARDGSRNTVAFPFLLPSNYCLCPTAQTSLHRAQKYSPQELDMETANVERSVTQVCLAPKFRSPGLVNKNTGHITEFQINNE